MRTRTPRTHRIRSGKTVTAQQAQIARTVGLAFDTAEPPRRGTRLHAGGFESRENAAAQKGNCTADRRRQSAIAAPTTECGEAAHSARGFGAGSFGAAAASWPVRQPPAKQAAKAGRTTMKRIIIFILIVAACIGVSWGAYQAASPPNRPSLAIFLPARCCTSRRKIFPRCLRLG